MDNNIPKAYILPANPSKIDLDKDEITISFSHKREYIKSFHLLNGHYDRRKFIPEKIIIDSYSLHKLEENNISFKIHQEDFYI